MCPVGDLGDAGPNSWGGLQLAQATFGFRKPHTDGIFAEKDDAQNGRPMRTM
jgi:hypothetical protein